MFGRCENAQICIPQEVITIINLDNFMPDAPSIIKDVHLPDFPKSSRGEIDLIF
ncbi:MAG: hypothetical protein ACP5G5_04525 [Thermoplasmata archaeon]